VVVQIMFLNGFIAIEFKNKEFVITRLKPVNDLLLLCLVNPIVSNGFSFSFRSGLAILNVTISNIIEEKRNRSKHLAQRKLLG